MATSVIPYGKNKVRDKSNTDTFTINLQAFDGYDATEYQGFLVLTRYGVFYLNHYHDGGTVQETQMMALYQTTSYSYSASMSNDGLSVTLTFGRTMYGGITVIG